MIRRDLMERRLYGINVRVCVCVCVPTRTCAGNAHRKKAVILIIGKYFGSVRNSSSI